MTGAKQLLSPCHFNIYYAILIAKDADVYTSIPYIRNPK